MCLFPGFFFFLFPFSLFYFVCSESAAIGGCRGRLYQLVKQQDKCMDNKVTKRYESKQQEMHLLMSPVQCLCMLEEYEGNCRNCPDSFLKKLFIFCRGFRKGTGLDYCSHPWGNCLYSWIKPHAPEEQTCIRLLQHKSLSQGQPSFLTQWVAFEILTAQPCKLYLWKSVDEGAWGRCHTLETVSPESW